MIRHAATVSLLPGLRGEREGGGMKKILVACTAYSLVSILTYGPASIREDALAGKDCETVVNAADRGWCIHREREDASFNAWWTSVVWPYYWSARLAEKADNAR